MPVCSDEHLNAHWILKDDELGLLKGKSDPGRLTLCILLKHYQLHGHFPKGLVQVSEAVADFLAEQIGASADVLDLASTSADRMIRRHPRPIRLALLSFFCGPREVEIVDSLVDLLIGVTHKISARSEQKVVNELVGEVIRVQGKTTLLFRMAEAAQRSPNDPLARIKQRGAKTRLSITPFARLPEPKNLNALKQELMHRWPSTSLLDVLKETDFQVGFTKAFASSASRQAMEQDEVTRRLLLAQMELAA